MPFLRNAAPVVLGACARAAGILLLSVLLTAAVVRLLGGDPLTALAAIQAGSVGSPTSLAETLTKAAPLIMTGLSVAAAFRCGVWNIGAEGQFLVGMLGAAGAALTLPPLPPFLAAAAALAAGTAAGALWALLPALLKVRREVPEVISTIMLNFLAAYLVEYLVRGPMKDPHSASDWSPLLPEWSCLPRLRALAGVRVVGAGPFALDAGRLHLGVLLALLAAPVVWLWFTRSGTGFRVRAVGLNPDAAASAGISVPRTVLTAFLVSGALAGLGGGLEILGLIQRMYRYAPGTPGYGFSGIAVALLGGLHPAGVLASALFFGALAAGSNQMQRSAGISFHVAYVIQAAIVLLLISVSELRARNNRPRPRRRNRPRPRPRPRRRPRNSRPPSSSSS